MTAPLTISRPGQHSSGSAVVVDGSPPSTIERIVSVSPKHAAAVPADEGLDRTVAPEGGFITPRVIDQAAFDDLAKTLRSLIDEASSAGHKLTAQIGQAYGADARAVQAAQNLQDRLRLGARMLSAFQSQIARVESLIAALDQREQAAEEGGSPTAAAKTALAFFETEVKQVISEAEQRIDQRLSEIPAAVDEAKVRLAESLHGLAAQINPALDDQGDVQSLDEAELSAGAD